MAAVQLLLLLLLCWEAALCRAFTFVKLYHKKPAEPVDSVPDCWFLQKLDHFNGADSRNWMQRFFVNDSFMQPGGPVFLMIGGEGPANPAWMKYGSWLTFAEKLGALCLMLEHRFYGLSHPTKDMSVENLRYLSSRQALADIAHFQTVMTKQLKLGDRKWVVFGGSYPGSLAAWYRLKYPHLAYAAVASSAPVNAVVNFPEYLEVVQNSLARNHSACPKAMKLASDSILELLQYKENYKKLTEDFRLCKLLQLQSDMDISFFLDSIAEYMMDIVQYNNDNREFEGVKGGNVTIQVVCDIMDNESLGAPYDQFVVVIQTILNALGQKCIDAQYKNFVQEMRDDSWEGPASQGGRQWVYQTCTEFGFFQSTDSDSQPFSGFPLSYHIQQCSDIYGSAFNLSTVTDAVQQTNEYYGGFGIKSSRIIFPNGLIDPWHALGINSNLSSDCFAIQMEDAAHCADMYPERPGEPSVLPMARNFIFQLLTKWLQS
ncbi:putative serine protease K12H4.7 [Spea bombifrons]|uniref:putative serine protease K12H4.7 n=1 Tax=Spea bombifrons TaxID=233779 RepID=UPI00234AE439|nr:putative serine protease K12H4.7 [Spea bombifrons]